MEKYDNKVFWDFCVHFSMQLEFSFQKNSCYIPLIYREIHIHTIEDML